MSAYKTNAWISADSANTLTFSASIKNTHHSFFSEVYSHCCDELGVEFAVCVLIQEAGLSHPRVPQREELDEVIIVPIRHTELNEDLWWTNTRLSPGQWYTIIAAWFWSFLISIEACFHQWGGGLLCNWEGKKKVKTPRNKQKIQTFLLLISSLYLAIPFFPLTLWI